MKKNFVYILLLSVLVAGAQEEQVKSCTYKQNNAFELTGAFASSQSLGSAAWLHTHAITKKKKFKIGYGIRFNYYNGRNREYYTAPAKLTSKQTGPQVLFSETFPENIDTFTVSKASGSSVNALVVLQYSINSKIDIGFNIDAVGFSFGKATSGTFKSSINKDDDGQTINATPTKLNALLVSDNDIGMLNSELYVRYWFNQQWAIKLGPSFAFTEYTTDRKLTFDNDRFRNKSLMIMFGVSYNPFKS